MTARPAGPGTAAGKEGSVSNAGFGLADGGGTQLVVEPADGRSFKGRLRAPGDKSISHRSLLIAAPRRRALAHQRAVER